MNGIGISTVGLTLMLVACCFDQPEERFCLDYQFDFSLADELKPINESVIKQLVNTVLQKTNCSKSYHDCEACSKQLSQHLMASSQQSGSFHLATIRLFLAAIDPNRTCTQPPPTDDMEWMKTTIVDAAVSNGSIELFLNKYQKLFASPESRDGNVEHARCFDSSRVTEKMSRYEGDERYIQLAQMVTGFIFLGFSFPCPAPSKAFFLRDLFSLYGPGSNLSRSNLTRLIDDLHEPAAKTTDSADRADAGRLKRDGSGKGKRECYDVDGLLKTFGIDDEVTWGQFVALSPALIHQQLRCGIPASQDAKPRGLTEAEKWGYGVLAVTVLSVSSLLGLLVFPFVKGIAREAIINFFIALAVASLAGDALLHLIPFFLGLESHEDSAGSDVEPHFYKLLTAYLTIFGFYFIEKLLTWLVPRMKKTKKTDGTEDGHQNPAYAEDEGHSHHHHHHHHHNHNHHHHNHHQHESPAGDPSVENGAKRVENKCCVLNGVVVVLTVGDALHNFTDGMAIAAAFSYSGSLGLSTSIAILCHEIPHELGDMAVYLSSGLNMLGTLSFNLLASLSAFIGLFIGYGISAQSESAQQWILAVTTGTFLYIALADLLPELRIPEENKLLFVLCHTFGFAIGGLIIILIAVYERQIRL